MNARINKLIALIAAAAVFFAFAACSGGVSKQIATAAPSSSPVSGTAKPAETGTHITTDNCILRIDARNAYAHPALSEKVRASLTNKGLLVASSELNVQTNGFNEFTLRVLASTMNVNIEMDPETGRITGINGVNNGFCGEGSYWVVLVNDQPVETALDQIEFKVGDNIVFVFTCNGGADLSDPGRTEYDYTGTPMPDSTPEPEATPEPEETPAPTGTSAGRKTDGRH